MKLAKIEAEKANQAKSDFLAQMSHEIRTPMNSILGFLEILTFTPLNSQQKDYINTVSESAKHLLNIINEILDFSKIEKGKLDLEYIPFNLVKFFDSTFKLFEAQANEKSITITREIDDTGVTIGDPFRIKQVLINLVGNAIKFTHENGTIKLTIKLCSEKNDKKKIYFEVSDNGIGIPKNRQEIIFQSFTQSHSSTSRMFGGTGLGLAICASLVKMMGSSIQLESSEGKGSRFYFYLELQSSNDEMFEEESTDEIEKNTDILSESDCRILVAEDTPTNQKVIKLMLNKFGIDPDIAENGLIAFDMFKEKKYDLVFMDGNMPVCDGFQSIAMIRRYENENQIKKTPVIALTAKAIKGDRPLFLKSGMDDYLTKPINLTTLLNTLKKHLGKNRFKQNKKFKKKKSPDDIYPVDFEILEKEMGLEKQTIAELLKDFIKDIDNYINALEKAIKNNDFKNIEISAHKLKGIAATYKIEEIVTASEQIENSASEKKNQNFQELFIKITEAAEMLKKTV